MSKDRTLLEERFSTAKQLLENKIDKTERAIKLFATDSRVHDILVAANLKKCCSFVEDKEDRSLASRELKASLKDLYKNKSTLLKHKLGDCKNLEECSDQIYEIIQARKLLKCIDQHDFKEALKIAGLSYIIKKGAPWISRIWITENTFFENLDKYLEVKWKEYKIIVEAYKTEDECRPSAPELSLSTPPEGSSNCNNTYVTNNNYPAVDSTSPSVLPLDHLCPQLPSDITTTSHTMNLLPKARRPAPSIPASAPPPYSKAVHDVSDETLLGDLYHHN